jgi:hypothetical protein
MELRESDALHDGWRQSTINAVRTCALQPTLRNRWWLPGAPDARSQSSSRTETQALAQLASWVDVDRH